MILSTTNSIATNQVVETLGMARGTVVRSRSIWRDLRAVFRIFVGGEILEYTSLVAQSREQAVDRMTAEARSMGANAIVGVRFATCQVSRAAAEVVAYGTAVRIKQDAP